MPKRIKRDPPFFGKFVHFHHEEVSRGREILRGDFATMYKAHIIGRSKFAVMKIYTNPSDFTALKRMPKVKRHQNLVAIIGMVTYKKRLCLLEEHYSLGSLDQLHDKIDLVHHFHQIASDVLRGLLFLHQDCGIVHGQLACRSLLMNTSGIVSIADYGVQVLPNQNQELTEIAWQWVAPERLLMEDEKQQELLMPKSDVWSLGVTLWEILSGGALPYAAEKVRLEITRDSTVIEMIKTKKIRLGFPVGTTALFCERNMIANCLIFDTSQRPTLLNLEEFLDNFYDKNWLQMRKKFQSPGIKRDDDKYHLGVHMEDFHAISGGRGDLLKN